VAVGNFKAIVRRGRGKVRGVAVAHAPGFAIERDAVMMMLFIGTETLVTHFVCAGFRD
jgi:hypothetical protein